MNRPAPPTEPESLQWLATFVGAAAIMAGSTALSAIISGTGWVLPLVEVVAVVTLIGVGSRMIRLPAVATVLLQLAAMSIALTALFTSSGYGGVIPNRQVVIEAGDLLSGAWTQILGNVPPAPSTPELSFLIAVSVGAAALIVDFVIAEAKAPALVALPLLCLYSVPASMAADLLPWYTFAAPAALYALLLAVAGHPGRRTGLRAGVGLAVNGAIIAALAIVVSLVVADAVTGVGTEGRLPRTQASSGQIGLSPFTTLHGNLQRSDPIDLLTVSGLPAPDYLRTVALTTWTPNQGWSVGDLRSDSTDINGVIPGLPAVNSDTQVTITSTAFRDKFLPVFLRTDAVNGLTTGWNFDSALGTLHRTDPINPGTYRVEANLARPGAAALRQDTVTAGGILTDTGSLPTEVRRMAADVTASAPTAFDKALALQQWFTDPANGFTYSLQVPVGNSGDLLLDFLQNKQGYCEQYASAMAVMLRALGIPARVAIGFTQGTHRADGSYLITSHDAHAWVEVRFDQAGWVRFDPTPLAGEQGGQQGFAQSTATASATQTTEVTATGSAPSAAAQRPDGRDPITATSVAGNGPGVASGAAAGNSQWSTILLTVLLIGLVVAIVLFSPTLVRSMRRRRRLARAGAGGPGAAAAAWGEIEDTAIDHGLPVRPAESARVAANRLARRAKLSEADRGRLRQVVVAAEQEWYDTSDTADPAGSASVAVSVSTEDLVGAVRGVVAGLARNEPITLADRWLPRSLRGTGR